MRKTYLFFAAACLIAAAVLSEFGCMRLGPVPNVMGSNYTAAKETLERAGYTVIAVEADAGNILSGTKWNRTVKKGEVFKVNNTACPDYTDQKEAPKVSRGKIRIYYARDDYICE